MKKIACGILILMLSIILVACVPNEDMQAKSSEVIDPTVPYCTYIFHDGEYDKDYIIVTQYASGIAITPRLTN